MSSTLSDRRLSISPSSSSLSPSTPAAASSSRHRPPPTPTTRRTRTASYPRTSFPTGLPTPPATPTPAAFRAPPTPSLGFSPIVPTTPSITHPPPFVDVTSTPAPPLPLPTPLHSPSTPASPALHTPHATPSPSPAQFCSNIMSAIQTRASSAVSSLTAVDDGGCSHRRSRSRDFWANLGFAASLPKVAQKEEDEEDSAMEVDSVDSAISLVLPPSLPKCTLSAAFQCSDTNTDIPPAFYPGQAIPTILTFQLERFDTLPHALHPALTMSLVGTLHTPSTAPRTIICVSVSLAEGLALWARDAAQAYASRAGKEGIPDTSIGLPGGTYSLPLTVQVPSTPRLPPTFTVDGASFAVTYALTVTLVCDDPNRAGNRLVLAETARPFEMMPETMPTRTPRFAPQSFWVRMDNETTPGAMGIKGCASASSRRPNHRWTITPRLPTTAFSPTSTIPLGLDIAPPPESTPEDKYLVLIRLSLLRREHSSLSSGAVDPATSLGLVGETEVSVRWAWIEVEGNEPVQLDDMELPIIVPGVGEWKHGYSTHLNVGPAASNHTVADMSVSVSSTFHLCATLAFLPLPTDPALSSIPPVGPATPAHHHPSPRALLQRHLPPQAQPLLPPLPGTFTPAESPAAAPTPVLLAHKYRLAPPTVPGAGAGNPSGVSLPIPHLKRIWPGTIKTLPLPIVIGSVAEPRGAMHTSRWSDLHIDRDAMGGESGRMIHGEQVSAEDGWIVPPPGYSEACAVVPYVYG